MRDSKDNDFLVTTDRDKIVAFYDRLRIYSPTPELIVKFNKSIHNLECLIAEDLADGLNDIVLPEHPEKCAVMFLRALSDLLGLEESLGKHLFVKHVNHSPFGTHCILGLRKRNTDPTISQRFIELEDNCFVVHLDQNNRPYMLNATYQKESEFAPTKCEWRATVAAALDHFAATLKSEPPNTPEHVFHHINHHGLVWVPDWNANVYRLNYKIRVVTSQQTIILLVAPSDEGLQPTYVHYSTDARDQPHQLQIVRVLNDRDATAPLKMLKDAKSVLLARRVLLKEVTHNDRILEGPYACVVDDLNNVWPTASEPDLDNQSSHLDRLMAYYHVDKIQRYFRALGLDLLNSYSTLNPVRVMLRGDRVTGHFSGEGHITFSRIAGWDTHKFYAWTDARNHKTIYHEYVHAVTDALARLQRQPKGVSAHKRRSEMLQAAAIDEGMADYFASALAAQQGDNEAIYRILQFNADGESLVWRKTASDEQVSQEDMWEDKFYRPLQQGPMNLAIVHEERELDEDIIYIWCQHWARYLWLLQLQMGADISDMLIANSILFLTRWSSFSLGVLALVVADRLLFDGQNRAIILETARLNLPDVSAIYKQGEFKQEIVQTLHIASAGTPTGVQLTEINREEDVSRLQEVDSAALSYSLTVQDDPPPSPLLDFGNLWLYDDEQAETLEVAL